MTVVKDAYVAAARARALEIQADQREFKDAVVAALVILREKRYDRLFCKEALLGFGLYSPMCNSVVWPPTDGKIF